MFCLSCGIVMSDWLLSVRHFFLGWWWFVVIVDLDCITNSYDIIYTDPPWCQKKGGKRACRPNQGRDLDYQTMVLSDIYELHKRVFVYTAKKHNVFMWTIDRFLFDAESMMKDLGYQLHARIIWDKCNGIAPAFTVRFAHEYLLWFYKKGDMLMPCKDSRGIFTDVLREPAMQHSRKPVCAYQMIESMFPDANKLELFARCERDGWDSFGNQVGYFKV